MKTYAERWHRLSKNKEQDFFIVGWVSDAHGIRGESYLRFYTSSPEWINDVDSFTLTEITQSGKERLKKKRKAEHLRASEIIKNKTLEFSKIKPHKQGVIVKFKEIKDRNQAEELKGLIVQIPKELLGESTEDEFYYHKIMGFVLYDQNKKACGVVSSHYNNSAHDILVLENDHPSKEVPFINDWIKNIDFDKKEIHMELPDGLFDIKA